MRIRHFDDYYDIPLRGLIESDGSLFAFKAELIQDADDDQWIDGSPARLQLFMPDDSLFKDFAFVDREFRRWFKDKSQQLPHYESDYQAALERIATRFQSLQESGQIQIGWMNCKDGEWTFTPQRVDSANDLR